MSLPALAISPDKRYLTTADGAPFFYLGDTDWELFHRCSREEAQLLCADRASKGFNVLQAVALAEIDGINTPNVYGHQPLTNDDPLKPVEEYWKHVDWVVDCANRHGLYVGLLPTWGDKWNKGSWGKGPVVFNERNARAYGKWIGARYRNAGVIWIMGGDRTIDTEEQLRIIRAMSEGVREGDGGAHLMTFHPCGNQTSSKFVGAEPWLDFNMCQTGHSRNRASWAFYDNDFGFLPRKPFVNGEPPYEAHPNNFRGGDEGWLDQVDVRRELYWAVCSCASGFTYGCHAIWQMYEPPRDPINLPRDTWKNSLALPGASQVQHGRKLALSRPWESREQAQWALLWPHSDGENTIRACRDKEGSWLFAYLPNCQRIKLHQNAVHGDTLRVTWYNPRTGTSVAGGEVAGGREQSLQPPFDPEGRDWVLVLDDTAKGYPLP
jgi:hypothetical protein